MGVLYNRITDLNNLSMAFENCKEQVGWKESVQKFESHKYRNLVNIRKSLIDKTYEQMEPYCFILRKRGKIRNIKAVHISDRVVQKALCDYVLVPELSKYLIYDNGSSLKGKGIDFARKRLTCHLQRYYRNEFTNEGYILLIDCKKYFDSMDHKVLLNMFEDLLWDKDVINLISKMLNKNGNGKIGVDIGNQLSQISGLLYLSKVDNYCKIVKGLKYYARFADDIYIIHQDKEFLKELKIELEDVFKSLRIEMNQKKTQIKRIDKGFVYLKYFYILRSNGSIYKRPTKKVIRNIKVKLKKMKNNNVNIDDILRFYKSRRGTLSKYGGFPVVKQLDSYFNNLFGDYF